MKQQARGVGRLAAGGVFAAVLLMASGAAAEQMTSPSYILNGNAGGSFGGTISSPNYNMTSIGGEAVVGNGSSSSYILDQQWPTQSITPTMQLTVQPSGLVGYWPLDEGTGTTTADASRYQHNGTLQSTADWYIGSGKLGASVDFHGANDSSGTGAVLVPDNTDLPTGSAMTVELWARQATWVGNQAFASHWIYDASGNGSGSWALQTGINNNLRVFIAATQGDPGNNYVDTAASTWNTFNTWRHIVMVYDGSQTAANRVKIYLDGVQLSTTMFGTIPATLQDSTGSFSIGSFPGLGRALTGAIDHVKLFNRALTSSEVTAEYNAQNAGSPAGTTLGAITNSSVTTLVDAAVRTNATSYTLSVSQDHNLQSGANTIPAVSGSIASPAAWNEGTTVGLGFTILSAPTLDSKWGAGANYAAFPGSGTVFYSEPSHAGASTVDVVGMRIRLGIGAAQPTGAYSNTITYTGTTLP